MLNVDVQVIGLRLACAETLKAPGRRDVFLKWFDAAAAAKLHKFTISRYQHSFQRDDLMGLHCEGLSLAAYVLQASCLDGMGWPFFVLYLLPSLVCIFFLPCFVSSSFFVLYLHPSLFCIFILPCLVSSSFLVLYLLPSLFCIFFLPCFVSSSFFVLYLLPSLFCIFFLRCFVSSSFLVLYLLPSLSCIFFLLCLVSSSFLVLYLLPS